MNAITTPGQKAVVLSSGGLDSSTVMAIAKDEGFKIYSLSFFYGQRHAIELDAAAKVADALGAQKHLVIHIDLGKIGGSALTDDIDVPKTRDEQEKPIKIPVTYVPARNTIFLAHALAWAEVIGSSDIFIGVNAIDYSGYPDCRPEYFKAFETLLKKGTKSGKDGRHIKVITPLIGKTKSEIIKIGSRLNVPYHLTWSCYAGKKIPCMECDSCLLREKGFHEAGIKDPLL